VTPCAFCGRGNDDGSRFCMDCGKPLTSSASSVPFAKDQGSGAAPAAAVRASVPASYVSGNTAGHMRRSLECPSCSQELGSAVPFCSACGKATGFSPAPSATCGSCGAGYQEGIDRFCMRCGSAVGHGGFGDQQDSATAVLSAQRGSAPRLALLDDAGKAVKSFTLDSGEAVVGRADADIRFPDDVYLSPVHAQLCIRGGNLYVRDLGSRNGTWVFLDAPCKLCDGDLMLIGSQILRFRRLGYPGPHPPEADATRRTGSLTPSADIAILAQLRADGSVRDTMHLSPGRNILIGREAGDWVFPYDLTMSGRHAEIRSEDSEFVMADAGSRNGVAISVRGERMLSVGQRVLVGDRILRVENL
jgi:pSer/pThr/pTyr-binding forkhead associated (FHA) protein